MNDQERRRLGAVELESLATPVTVGDAGDLVSGWQRGQAHLLTLYQAARTARRLYGPQGIVAASWRCSKGCVLLDVFPTGIDTEAEDVDERFAWGVFKPYVKMSPQRAEQTSPKARMKRTTDGERRWIEHADFLLWDDNGQWEYWLSCDHVENHKVSSPEVRTAAVRRAGLIFIP